MSKIEEIKDTAVRLLSGILSNPNYNFGTAKKAADIAIEHAQALVIRFAEGVEDVADKVGDKARGSDDKPTVPVTPVKPDPSVTAVDPLTKV